MIFLISVTVTVNIYAQDYFPLQIGNYWVYDLSNVFGIDSREIVDTTQINGKWYYCFLDNSLSLDRNAYIYYRKDSLDQVWIAHGKSGVEHIVYKLGASPGTEWYYTFDDSYYRYTLIDTNYVLHTPAGTFENYYNFETLLIDAYAEWYDYLAPYIGMIRRDGETVGSILKGALINSVLYGDTTATELKNGKRTKFVKNYILYQNTPNPFNPHTSIRFDLVKASEIKLSLYDIRGRVVTTLTDGSYEAGRYSVKLDGRELASGVYFIKLYIISKVNQMNSKIFTKKIMLLK